MGFTLRSLFVRIGFDINDGDLRSLDRRILGTTKSIRNFTIAVATATAGLGFFLKTSGQFEQLDIAFETLIGDAKKAKETLRDLFEFSQRTPFIIPDILVNAKMLLGMGIEAKRLINTMKILGDVAAAFGPKALGRIALNFGQVRSQMKLTGRELRDFNVIGVPLLEELTKQFGKTGNAVRKMIQAGDVSFEDVRKAFITMTSEGGKFFDLMIKQSRSLFGLVSIVRDRLILITKAIGDSLLPAAKGVTKQFLEYLEVNRKIIEQRGAKFFSGLAKVLAMTWKATRALGESTLRTARIFGGIETVVKSLTLAYLALTGVRVVAGIGALILSFRTLGKAGLIAQAKILAVPLLTGAAFIALGLILEDIKGYFEGADSITGLIIAGFKKKFPEKEIEANIEGIKSAFLALKDFLKVLFIDFWKGVFTLDQDMLLDSIANAGQAVKDGFIKLGEIAKAAFTEALKGKSITKTELFLRTIGVGSLTDAMRDKLLRLPAKEFRENVSFTAAVARKVASQRDATGVSISDFTFTDFLAGGRLRTEPVVGVKFRDINVNVPPVQGGVTPTNISDAIVGGINDILIPAHNATKPIEAQ